MSYALLTVDGASVPLLSTEIAGKLRGERMLVSIRQRYQRPNGSEAAFFFPLSRESAPVDLDVICDGARIEGRILDRGAAIERLGDASLAGCGPPLGNANSLLFTSFGNDSSSENTLVEVSYRQSARAANGALGLVIPAASRNERRPHASTYPNAELRFEDARGRLQTVRLGAAPAYIGRRPECAVRVEDPAIDSRHALITFEGGRYWITDVASSSPTRVNGRPVFERQVLSHADVVLCCRTRLSFLEPASQRRQVVDPEGHPYRSVASTTDQARFKLDLTLAPSVELYITSPTHDIAVSSDGPNASASLATLDPVLDRDVVIRAHRKAGPPMSLPTPLASITVGTQDGEAEPPRPAEVDVLAWQQPSGLWGPTVGADLELAEETLHAVGYLVLCAQSDPKTPQGAQIRKGAAAAIELAQRIAAEHRELSDRLWETASILRSQYGP